MNKPGSIAGGALLIAGSCIGAGMLGLPIITGIAGFFPSLVMFFIAWAFMTITGLLMVETNGYFSKQVNLLTITHEFLGVGGKWICWGLYLFLFYALQVAYISGSGSLFSSLMSHQFSSSIPDWVGSLLFVILFGGVVLLGTRGVDLWNRVLMVFKILCFVCLVFIGIKYIRPQLLLKTQASYAVFSLPILITSFGFHNMIPSLTAYMHRDLQKVRKSIWAGSLLTLFIYLIWQIIVLGCVPIYGPGGLMESFQMDREGSQALGMFVSSSWLFIFSQGLAFFAILTSFLAQSLGLVHFLADGCKVAKEKKENIGLCLLALLPPLIFSLIYPQLFFKALGFAGGCCAVILFGIFPTLMVFLSRYRREYASAYRVFGGKGLLLAIFIFALGVFLFQLSNMFGMFHIINN